MKKLATTILKASFEFLILLPFILVIGVLLNEYFDLSLSVWLIALFIGFYVGLMFRYLFNNQRWWLYIIVALCLGIGSGLLLVDDIWLTVIFALILPIIIYRGMMYATRTLIDLLPISFLWGGGMTFYFFMYFLFRNVDLFRPYLDWLSIAGILLVVVTFFITNNERLKTATLEKEKNPQISPTIRRQNKLYLGMTLFVIAVISLPTFQQRFFAFISSIVQFIFSGATGDVDVPTGESTPAPSEPMLPEMEPKEPALFWIILEKIFIYLVYAFLIIGGIVALFMLFKKSRLWIKKLYQRFVSFLKRITKQTATPETMALYVDEKESIFSWEGWRQELQSKTKNWVKNLLGKKPSWEDLTTEEKVRYVYRHVIEGHENLHVEPGDTPRELLERVKDLLREQEQKSLKRKNKGDALSKEEQTQYERNLDLLRALYEDVRYGEKFIQQEEVRYLNKLIDQGK